MTTLWEGMVHGKPVSLVDAGECMQVEVLREGLLSNIATGVWSFAKAHPTITTIAGLSAIDAIKKYNQAKKNVKFVAGDQTERKSMQLVVDMMVKSGYKIVRQAFKGSSGYEWELSRK